MRGWQLLQVGQDAVSTPSDEKYVGCSTVLIFGRPRVEQAVLSSIMCFRRAFLYCRRVRLMSGEDVVLSSLLDLNRAKILYGL